MKIPEGLCPCNSGKSSTDCCYQLRPPIDRDEAIRINGFNCNTTMQVFDNFGLPMTPKYPARAKLNIKTSDIFEQDDFIHRIMKDARRDVAEKLYTRSFNDKEKSDNAYESGLVDNLYRNIRATYYHLQGFIFRFTRLAQLFDQKPVNIGQGIKVTEEDLSLELEFESFMIRYRTCVELTVKLIAFKATSYDPRNKNKYDFKKTIEYVRKYANNPMRKDIAQAIDMHENWIEEQRKIRHAIAHDGITDALNSFEHVRGTTLNATVLDRTANFMCTQMFNELIEFLTKIVHAIYAPNTSAMEQEACD